jgi:hypothetical protein
VLSAKGLESPAGAFGCGSQLCTIGG